MYLYSFFFFFNDTATTEIYTLSLHDALPILSRPAFGVEVHLVDEAEQRLAPGEIALHQPAIDGVIAESGIGKSPVGCNRLALALAHDDLAQLAGEGGGAPSQRLGVSD